MGPQPALNESPAPHQFHLISEGLPRGQRMRPHACPLASRAPEPGSFAPRLGACAADAHDGRERPATIHHNLVEYGMSFAYTPTSSARRSRDGSRYRARRSHFELDVRDSCPCARPQCDRQHDRRAQVCSRAIFFMAHAARGRVGARREANPMLRCAVCYPRG